MADINLDEAFKVSLHNPMTSSAGHQSIQILYGINDILHISLRRNVRVPDDGSPYEPPPDCGSFPICSVKDYKNNLPKNMTTKGGLFVPIYEREAMKINFESSRPFAVKMYARGVNVISGEPQDEGLETMRRRKLSLAEGKSIQDYIVSTSQESISGVTTADGKFTQFIATPAPSASSAEVQVTGKDAEAGLQFEIMPTKRKFMCVLVARPAGTTFVFEGIDGNKSLSKFKAEIEGRSGVPPDNQVLLFAGRILEDGYKTLLEHKIHHHAVIHLVLNSRMDESNLPSDDRNHDLEDENAEKYAYKPADSRSIVKDRIPYTDWDQQNTILLNLQLLNASTFGAILGMKAPDTPITPALYEEQGYPFFQHYEEPGGVKGVKVGAKKRKKLSEKEKAELEEQMKRVAEVDVNTVDVKRPFLPVAEMEEILGKLDV